MTTYDDLDCFTQGYIDAAMWTECNSDNPELENADFTDIHPDCVADIIKDCEAWQKEHVKLLDKACERGYDAAQAGHDYWLTRNGHGVGFWDRVELDAGDLGKHLTAACEYQTVDVYRGDDHKVYFT